MKIYDLSMDRTAYRSTRVFGFVVGVPFLTWYLLKAPAAVRADCLNFLPALHEAPILTIGFAILKVWAYVFFPFVAAAWIYISVKDLFGRRRIGKLHSIVSACSMDESSRLYSFSLLAWVLSWAIPLRSPRARICLGEHEFVVLDSPSLSTVINRADLIGKEIAVTCGAFNRVLSVELLGS